MAALELEDGELLDSDSDHEASSKIQASSTISQNYRKPVNPTSYRSKSDAKIASSSSDDSDDEKFTWKKKRYGIASKDQQSSMEFSFSNSINTNSTFQVPNAQFSFGQGVTDSNTASKPKKKNIWGSVLRSQMLSQGFHGFDMEHKEEGYSDRQVESYSYKKALKDTRPWPAEAGVDSVMPSKKNDDLFDSVPDLEKLEENFNGVYKKAEKRRRSAKKRLGPKPTDRAPQRKAFDVTVDDDEEKVTEAIADFLEESKVYLIEKVVQVLGKKKALAVTRLTRDIEDHGGMMTNDGGRRRTPGGVFFQLLKTDSEVTKQNMKDIFNDEKKEKAKTKKILRAKRFKNKLKKRMEAETDSTGNVTMETVGGEQKEDRLAAVVSDDTSSNSKDSYSQSNSSELSNDPVNLDMSDLLKRHKEYQSEQQSMTDCSGEKTDKDSTMQDQLSKPSKKTEKRPDAIIYLDEDVDMSFDL
ncbi:phosphorylated adapter RNA export protein [Octopus sinensis]|uniref:Phosphorylated adapter RNA export protein n=1 Tax=Octopus sinensis TaxID=2607531 RepID=A0A6P7TKE0_9MOLL|nr:phosphorylated adapter RNA export protein [Octopus sinensis]